MTRDEAKVLMRQELESDLTDKERVLPIHNLNGLTCNDLMAEVEKGTALGEAMLDDFIFSKADESPGNTTMDQAVKETILILMQMDIDNAPKGWVDQPITTDDQGNELTPLQVMQQVKDGTDWGNQYAESWLIRYRLYQTMDRLADVLPLSDSQKLLDGVGMNSKDSSKLN